MADRSSIAEINNIGIETTPGTAVAANRRLQATKFSLSPDVNFENFKPAGAKLDTIVAPTKEWTSGSIEGKLTYNELVYLLSMNMTSATPTQIMDGATPTGAYRWTFNPATFGADSPKTATVEVGQALRAHRTPFTMLTGLSFDVSRDDCAVGGTVMAQRLEDGVTLTASPTQTAAEVVLPGQCDVYLDTTVAGIGGTKLTRLFDYGFSTASRFGGVFPVDSTKPSYADYVELEPTLELKISLEADAAGMALLTPMRAGDTRYVRLRAIGSQIYAGALPTFHQLTVDLACKVKDVGDFGDKDGVDVVEWTFAVAHDPAWGTGKGLTIEAINKLATL